MRLLAEGYQLASVARQVGVARITVRDWRDSPEGQAQLAKARAERATALAPAIEDARRILADALPRAAQMLVDTLDPRVPATAVTAAQAILDRAGLPRTEVHESTGGLALDLTRLSAAELDALEALAAKARGDGGG